MATLVLSISALYLGITLLLLRGLLKTAKTTQHKPFQHSFSIVIAAHNEEETIVDCLNSVCNQTINASRFEVIVVNDRSTDATAQRIAECMLRFPNLCTISITHTEKTIAPKKHAVLKGIAAAHNPIIVFTDADCRVPATWLVSIDTCLAPEVMLMQGITKHVQLPSMNPVFFRMQALDFCSHGIIAAAGIGCSIPINSNANNMAFRKSAFDTIGGYGGNEKVVLGDDDLLVQKISSLGKKALLFNTDPSGSVVTLPTKTIGELFEQRKKWGSVAVHYGPQQLALLGTIFCFYALLAFLLIASIVYPAWIIWAFCMLGVKVLGELFLLWPGTKIFNAQDLRAVIIPSSILHLPMVLIAVVMGTFFKFDWKGQKFKRTLK